MIVLNEKEYAEQCLKSKTIGDKPFFTLSILAKYYYHCHGYRKKKITDLLISFISECYPRYSCNRADWDAHIEKLATSAGKYTLFEIDGIWITRAELDTIEGIHNKVLERLAFTMLCLAKLGNARNSKNNGWVNYTAKDIYSMARISCSVIDRYEKLSQLNQLSLLEFPKKNDNLSSRVTYVDDDSEKILFIYDFRELGYEYLKYKGENFIRCRECDILVRNNKCGDKKYCSNCAGYVPMERKQVTCVDCGVEFTVNSKNNKTHRCVYCQKEYVRAYDRERKKRDNSV